MSKFLRWLMWRGIYLVTPTPKTFLDYLKMSDRTEWPWRKFEPSAWHNDDGRLWHIALKDELSFVRRTTMKLDVHISCESGEIIGFDVFDEELRPAQEANQ